jgi:hypothetical protein
MCSYRIDHVKTSCPFHLQISNFIRMYLYASRHSVAIIQRVRLLIYVHESME